MVSLTACSAGHYTVRLDSVVATEQWALLVETNWPRVTLTWRVCRAALPLFASSSLFWATPTSVQ